MTIVAVIPAFNEEIAIGSVIARARQHVDEVLVIDDGSTDNTSQVALLMGATVIRHELNAGKGAALHTAFKWALLKQVRIMVTLDADGQHNPDEIPQIIDPILWKRADIVNGARFLKGHSVDVPKYRRAGQEILTLATNMTSNIKLTDSQSGFRAFSKETFGAFKFKNAGMGVESEMIADAVAAGFKITEVPITCRYDVDGSTFNPVKHGMAVLGSIINQFERKHPLFYFGVPGFLVLFTGLVLGFWTVYGYQVGETFWIGKALLAMTFVILGSFGIFSGLILNSVSTLRSSLLPKYENK
jgi:glycosyltransferase involved in cell wall biosynthesis